MDQSLSPREWYIGAVCHHEIPVCYNNSLIYFGKKHSMRDYSAIPFIYNHMASCVVSLYKLKCPWLVVIMWRLQSLGPRERYIGASCHHKTPVFYKNSMIYFGKKQSMRDYSAIPSIYNHMGSCVVSIYKLKYPWLVVICGVCRASALEKGILEHHVTLKHLFSIIIPLSTSTKTINERLFSHPIHI